MCKYSRPAYPSTERWGTHSGCTRTSTFCGQKWVKIPMLQLSFLQKLQRWSSINYYVYTITYVQYVHTRTCVNFKKSSMIGSQSRQDRISSKKPNNGWYSKFIFQRYIRTRGMIHIKPEKIKRSSEQKQTCRLHRLPNGFLKNAHFRRQGTPLLSPDSHTFSLFKGIPS